MVWRGVRGLADIATGAPIVVDTIFDIGSTTQQFTAAAVLLLAQDGKIGLQAPFTTYVPGFPGWASKITVDQLIHQTSGGPDYIPIFDAEGLDRHDLVTQAMAVDALRAVTSPSFAPGSSWEYSNANYVLLAEVASAASGQELPDLRSTTRLGPAV